MKGRIALPGLAAACSAALPFRPRGGLPIIDIQATHTAGTNIDRMIRIHGPS